jgi:hypothetical protein
MPADDEQRADSSQQGARTLLVKQPDLLPPSQWQQVKRGMPLGKAVAYCQAKGIKVSMNLMVPEELQHA